MVEWRVSSYPQRIDSLLEHRNQPWLVKYVRCIF